MSRSSKPFVWKKGAVVLVNSPSEPLAQVRLGLRIPSLKAEEHYALLVANAYLGGYFGSRLNAELRDKLSLTYGVTSTINYNKEFATLTLSAPTRHEMVGQLISRVIEILTQMQKEAQSTDEIEAAKAYLEGGFPLLTSTVEAVASRLAHGCVV